MTFLVLEELFWRFEHWAKCFIRFDNFSYSVLWSLAVKCLEILESFVSSVGVDSRQVSSEPDLSSPFLGEKKPSLQPWQTLQQMFFSPGGVLLWMTIPNVKLQPRRYLSSFFMSMAWLSITAYIVCVASDRISILWQIPKSFLGLTLVAVGTSWPNLLASIVTARRLKVLIWTKGCAFHASAF